ncbi:MAG: hypothetical protein PVJ86_03960 [Phycisphaerales bacterium]
MTDAVGLPPSLAFLEFQILARLDDWPGLLKMLCRITLCRACPFAKLCGRFEAGEELSHVYLFAPSIMGA